MDMEKILRHMAWANQQVIGQIAAMPKEALDAYAVNPEWTVGTIVRHIASASNWYVWRLLDRTQLTDEDKSAWKAKLEETEIPPKTMREMPILLERLAKADAVLLAAAQELEGFIVHTMDGRTVNRARSTIISQSIHHATEHRAQLVSALEAKGFVGINLDDYDVWYYSDTIGE